MLEPRAQSYCVSLPAGQGSSQCDLWAGDAYVCPSDSSMCVFLLPLDCQHLLGEDCGACFLVRGNVESERDLELGQLRLESGSGSRLLFRPGR